MNLNNWNPLSHFNELRIFPKVLLLVGFIFLGIGINRGLSPQNRTAILSFAIISFSLASHYFSISKDHEIDPPYRNYIVWSNVFWGMLLLIITSAFLLWLYCLMSEHCPIRFLCP